MRGRLDPHARFRELLAARLDRPLSRAESRLLATHLKGCPGCRQAERDYQEQRALLRSMSTPTPPRDMWARTSTALDREVSRWSYRYPRVGRRMLARAARSGSGAPSAMATVVAALGVVMVLAVMQLAPGLRPVETAAGPDGTTAAIRPTPFAVAPQPLVGVSSGDTDLTIYQTQVTEVCPTTAPDCFDDKEVFRQSVSIPNMRPENVALSPNGGQIAFVGRNTGRDVIAVVLLRSDGPAKTPKPRPTQTQEPGSSSAGSLQPSPTPAANESPDLGPSPSDTPTTETPDPASPNPGDPTPAPVQDTPTPTGAAVGTPAAPPTLSGPPTVPPASAVPGLTVLSILEDVHSAGAPPAWSTDGEVLSFSAMPADGSTGPDVYVWQRGDDQAVPITADHASYFASWSGERVVASRIIGATGKSETLGVETVVIDPATLEERFVGGPQMWLPVVDPARAHAVTWSGELDLSGALPTILSGELYLVDWTALDPFGTDDATGNGDPSFIPIDPDRDPIAEPVLDWNARWSGDGRVLGIWEAETPGGSWGSLVLAEFDPESGALELADPLFAKFAKRGFSLGLDRVAWVSSPTDENPEGELRIRTWGTDGVGDLRIESLDVEGLVPSF